jgi:pimeloyl-ACP methyl ester carboxylesterase
MSVTVQGVNVFYKESGAGDTILFLHGAPDSAEMWDGVIEELQGAYHCFALDLPGFGRSTAPRNFDCSLENMGHFLDAFLSAAAIPTPLHLVVADFGATYGLSWAVSYPEKVKSITMAGGSNFSSHYQWHGDARLFRVPVLGELIMSTLSLPLYEKTMQKNAPLLNPEYVRSSYALSLAKKETRRMMLKLYRSINPVDFRGKEDRLHALIARIPALVLWGDKDPFITPTYAHQFGKAEVIHFPENGHWLAVEAPQEVARHLAHLLTSKQSNRPE